MILLRLAPIVALAGGIVAQPSSVPGRIPRHTHEYSCGPAMPHTFVVPDSVSSVSIEAHGGRGGSSHGSRLHNNPSGGGGYGAVVRGKIAVTPGQRLTIWVGCAGDARSGFGGGGTGGQTDPNHGRSGGAGGSASAVFVENAPLVVAGGGGGAGGAGELQYSVGGSGGSGGAVPQAGSSARGTGAGEGGCAQCADSAGAVHARSVFNQGGGAGGGGGGYSPDPNGRSGAAGGEATGYRGAGGGGGAGASYVAPSLSEAAIATSTRPGDGLVRLSFSSGTPQLGNSPESSWTFGCTGSPATWQVPQGVTQIVLDVRGGSGADGESETGGYGGPGGRVVALTSVSVGQTLTIYTGCGGQGRDGGYGYMIGGKGGSSGKFAWNGGGGGGASAVLIDGTLATIAGGGGGGGGNSSPVSIVGIGNGGSGNGGNGADGKCPGAPDGLCPIPKGGVAIDGAASVGGPGDSPSGSADSLLLLGGGGGGGGGAAGGTGGEPGNSGALVTVIVPGGGTTVTNFAAMGAGGGGGTSHSTLPTSYFLTSPSGPDGQVTIFAGKYAGLDAWSCLDAPFPDTATLPSNAYGMSVEAVGASGVSPRGQGQFAQSGRGGFGGIANGLFTANPSSAFFVMVGCQDQTPDADAGAPGGKGGSGKQMASDGGHGGSGSALSEPNALNGPFLLIAGGGGGGGGAANNGVAPAENYGGNGGNGGLLGSTGGSGGCCSGGGGGTEEGNSPYVWGGNGTGGADNGVDASGGGGGGGGGNLGGGHGHGSNGQGGGGGGAGGISDISGASLLSSHGTASTGGGGSLIIKYLQGSAPLITSGAPPRGVVGQTFNFQVMARGFPFPTFTLSSGSLPAGLSLDSTSGVISGTPQATGSSAFSIQAGNGIGTPNVVPYSVRVFEVPTITSGAPTFEGVVGQPYSFQITATGDPAPTFGIWGPTGLPPGLSLNAQTGLISGTPTAATGTLAFQIVANNGIDPYFVSPVYYIAVNGAPSITSGPPTVNAQVGTPYRFLVTTSPPGTETMLYGGQLPPGLTLTLGGVLSGTPTASGVYRFQIAASSGVPPVAISPTYQINVAAGDAPVITSSAPPSFVAVGIPFSFQVTATGSPAPMFSVASGQLPLGLSLNSSTGLISGATLAEGSYTFTIRAGNGIPADAISPMYLMQVYKP